MLLIIGILWAVGGLIVMGFVIHDEGEFVVEDIKMIPVMALFGLLFLVFMFFEKYQHHIIWKAKPLRETEPKGDE